MVPVEALLAVERVDMGKPAGQKDHDQVPGFRFVMSGLRGEQSSAQALRSLNKPCVA
jgi:hypothetical protein